MAGNRTGYLVAPRRGRDAGAQDLDAHRLPRADLGPGRGTARAARRRRLDRARARQLSRGRRGHGEAARVDAAGRLDVPLHRRGRAARRARPVGLPRGLRRRRRGARAGAVVRIRVPEPRAPLLHGGAAGAGARRGAPAGRAPAGAPSRAVRRSGSDSSWRIHSAGRPCARAPSTSRRLYQAKGTGSEVESVRQVGAARRALRRATRPRPRCARSPARSRRGAATRTRRSGRARPTRRRRRPSRRFALPEPSRPRLSRQSRKPASRAAPSGLGARRPARACARARGSSRRRSRAPTRRARYRDVVIGARGVTLPRPIQTPGRPRRCVARDPLS